jgi:hypothetical protein
MTLRLAGSTSGYTEIDAPAVAGSNTLVLPTGNGTSGQVLTTNGSGTLSWTSDVMLSAGSAGSPSLYFSGDANTGMWSPSPDTVAWSTGGTERTRLQSNGAFCIGTTSQISTELLTVRSPNSFAVSFENTRNSSSGDRGLALFMGGNTNNTSSYFIDCGTAGVGPKFYVYGNGTYGTVSDVNLKKNIETTRDGYLEDLCKLRVIKYNWKADSDDTPKELGWIAQELEQVFPGLVQDSQPDANGNTVKEVKTSVLQFMLLKALQEANAKIETLESRIAALEVTP